MAGRENLNKLNNPQRFEDIHPDYIWSKLNIDKANILVDIGAGTAFFSIAFMDLANPSKVYACDVSETMINWIKHNVVPKYPIIIPVKTEEDFIPLDDGIADLVFMINLHHELEYPIRTMEASHRILKPGGNIFIVDWKKEDMVEGPPTNIRYMPERVKEQLMNSGFRHINIYNELPKHFLVTGVKG